MMASTECTQEMFIDIIRAYPALYDLKNEDYKNKNVKENCWREVSEKVGSHSTIDEVKKRWKSLRDQYRRCHDRMCDSKSGSGFKKN